MARQWVLKNPGSSEGLIFELDDSGNLSFKLMSDGSALGSTVIADLTEDGGAIGGTSDGDLPDLATPGAVVNTASVRELATRINALQAELRAMGILGAS